MQFDNYGNGEGLEIIPAASTEPIPGVPAYQGKQAPKRNTSGRTDETLLGKYRFVAASEEQGNYIVSGFLGVSVPTGCAGFTHGKAIVTPTIAAGKGWGSAPA